jgi:hypothetical protein
VSIFLEFLPRESGRFLLEQLLYVYGLIYKSAVKLKRARRPKKKISRPTRRNEISPETTSTGIFNISSHKPME